MDEQGHMLRCQLERVALARQHSTAGAVHGVMLIENVQCVCRMRRSPFEQYTSLDCSPMHLGLFFVRVKHVGMLRQQQLSELVLFNRTQLTGRWRVVVCVHCLMKGVLAEALPDLEARLTLLSAMKEFNGTTKSK